ncbi:glycoside hydrolase family 20 zincin-like fold domain-containing protein [Actinotalea sp. Marseille-Q4924]|uniref:glycoside hydrolase family 20 zincin-like fold domain-containing protein n=1 Tax=Actinotalea sp. Marseille-Q4924 TaxID=2866571 RepID=UPI001CE4B34A|nr:glycoside hydrolase family 20 zincin-like fold domain-containing protein [Actinotalea sp. Marseille-Q4924]
MDVLGILPAPVSARSDGGPPFAVSPGVRIVVDEEPDAVAVAVLVAGRVGRLGDFPVAVVHTDDGTPGSVVLRLMAEPDATPEVIRRLLPTLGIPTALPPELAREAYRIGVTTDRVEVLAATAAGLVRGAATLVQLVDHSTAPWPSVPCVTVVDHPRLAWRGLQVDVSEHPLALADAKAIVNVLATLRMNVLHVRVADGVAWVPDVLEEGGAVASGFAELQAYAAARQIAVVPEIDVAGGRLDDDRLTEVLGRVAATTRAHVVHVGGRVGGAADGPPAHRCGDRVGRGADDVVAAGAVVMAWQCAATALSSARHPGHLLQVGDVTDPALAPAVADGAALVLSPPELDLGVATVTLRERYGADPVGAVEAAGLPAGAVLGVEALVGGAHGGTREGLFLALLPDLAAVAELAWSGSGAPGWASFVERVALESSRWRDDGLPVPVAVDRAL